MEFGPAACAVATASFFAQYVHLIGVWNLLDSHTFEHSAAREWCFFWGGIGLMIVSGTIRAHSCVGFALSPDGSVFQSPQSTRPGECAHYREEVDDAPSDAKCKQAQQGEPDCESAVVGAVLDAESDQHPNQSLHIATV